MAQIFVDAIHCVSIIKFDNSRLLETHGSLKPIQTFRRHGVFINAGVYIIDATDNWRMAFILSYSQQHVDDGMTSVCFGIECSRKFPKTGKDL